MALQGTFIDIGTGVFALGEASAGTVFHTIVHSLGTAPDVVRPIMTSLGNTATGGIPQLIGYGGNASVSTVGIVGSGTAGAVFFHGAGAYSVLAWKLYAKIK